MVVIIGRIVAETSFRRNAQCGRSHMFTRKGMHNFSFRVYDVGLFYNCDQTILRSSLYNKLCLHHLFPNKQEHTEEN